MRFGPVDVAKARIGITSQSSMQLLQAVRKGSLYGLLAHTQGRTDGFKRLTFELAAHHLALTLGQLCLLEHRLEFAPKQLIVLPSGRKIEVDNRIAGQFRKPLPEHLLGVKGTIGWAFAHSQQSVSDETKIGRILHGAHFVR